MSETIGPANEAVRRSRIKLILWFAFFVLLGLSFVTAGFLMRDDLLGRAGNLLVEVKNEASIKLRMDVHVEETFATLEMDPGESGVLRFRNQKEGAVLLRLYERNTLSATGLSRQFPPDANDKLTVRIKSPVEIVIE